MRPLSSLPSALAGIALLGLLPAVAAHGDEHEGMAGMGGMAATNVTKPVDPTYFRTEEYSALMTGHIAVMTITWVFVLPLGQ